MISVVLYLFFSVCYVMLYRLAVIPPHTWVTDVFLWVTWSCVILNVIFMCVCYPHTRRPMNRVMMAEIHMMFPEYRVIGYFFSVFACVLVLFEAGHVWTCGVVGMIGMFNMWFVWCLVLFPVETSDKHHKSDDLLIRASRDWRDGAFARVATYAEQMTSTEIEWLITTIDKNHGSKEAQAARRLLSS